jgi:hypothetical protein
MKIALILAVSAYSLFGWAQHEGDWRQGIVVLTDSRVLKGSVYLAGFETLLLRTDTGKLVEVFRAHEVHQVRYYDSVNNINRKFIAIKDVAQYNQAHKLYEVVLDGTIAIVRRLSIENESMMLMNNPMGYLYFTKADNEITSLSKFRERYFAALIKKCFGLNAFIESQKLNPNYAADAIRIIQFFNAQPSIAEMTTLNNYKNY